MDELSPLGETTIAEFYQGRALSESTISSTDLPLSPMALEDLAGGDAETNAAITRAILTGEETGPKREAVLLNTGAALFVADAASSITEGWELAATVIDDGRAKIKLGELAE
jgi:anthranilate phosphoribosyltransferase